MNKNFNYRLQDKSKIKYYIKKIAINFYIINEIKQLNQKLIIQEYFN